MQIHEMSYNDMAAEFDNMLRTLELINKLNSLGKTKEIADEIQPILEHAWTHQLLINSSWNAGMTRKTSVTIGISKESSLYEAIEAFEVFLIACGYSLQPNTHLDIVDNEN
jgi:hypothetical protein